MKKLRVPVILAAVVLAAGILTLAGCGNGTTTTTVEGAKIAIPWNPVIDTISPDGFYIATPPTPVGANPGEQVPEYAVRTSPTTPTEGYNTNQNITGLDPDTEYYVFARMKENKVGAITYKAGEAVRASIGENDTVKTSPEGATSSVVTTWVPILTDATAAEVFNSQGLDDWNRITLRAATPMVDGRTVEYNISTSGTAAPAANWRDPPIRFDIAVLTSATSQLYAWARTKAAGDIPAGVPLSKSLSFPGPNIAFPPSGFNAEPGNVTTSAGTVTITGGGNITRTPNIPLTIEYAVGGENTWPAEATAWHTLDTGTIRVTGLTAGTEYYLWARTKATDINFTRAGTPLRFDYPSRGFIFRTLGDVTSANALASTLRGLGGDVRTPSPEVVRLQGGRAALVGTLQIPPGVTLEIEGGELDANHCAITGGGGIEVSNNGILTVQLGMVSVDSITVNDRGVYKVVDSANPAGAVLIGTGAAIAVIELTQSQIVIRPNGISSSYTLEATRASSSSKATINKEFSMTAGESFTVKSGAVLDLSNTDGKVSGVGTLVIESGGRLTGAKMTDFNGLVVGGNVVINYGAYANLGSLTIGYDSAIPAQTTGHIELQPAPAYGNFTVTREYTGATNSWATSLALTGSAVLATSSALTIQDYVFDIKPGQTLIIPAEKPAREIKVSGGMLNVGGTLTLAEPGATVSGGKLTVEKNGILNVGSSMTVGKGTTLLVTGAVLSVNNGGQLNINGSAMFEATENVNGTVTVANGGVLEINGGSVRGGGTITVNGKLDLPKTGMDEFLPSTTNTSRFSGSVVIGGNTGQLWHKTYQYIGFVTDQSPHFLINNNSTMNISTSTTPTVVPVLSISGTASVDLASGSAGGTVYLNGSTRLYVPNGSTLTFNKNAQKLNLSNGELWVGGSLSGPGAAVSSGASNNHWAAIVASGTVTGGKIKKVGSPTAPASNTNILAFFGNNSETDTDSITNYNLNIIWSQIPAAQ